MKNNDRNPTLREAEKAKGRSGEAELDTGKSPDKKPGPR